MARGKVSLTGKPGLFRGNAKIDVAGKRKARGLKAEIDITSKRLFHYTPKKSKQPRKPKFNKGLSGRSGSGSGKGTSKSEGPAPTTEAELFAQSAQFRLKRSTLEDVGKLPARFGDVLGRSEARGYSILQVFQGTQSSQPSIGEKAGQEQRQRLFMRLVASQRQERERHLQEKAEIAQLLTKVDPLLIGEIQNVASSNVTAFQYYGDSFELIIEYHDGAFYLYMDVSHDEARSLLYAGSKGNWVWDNLRVRGTVFGYQKVYMHISGFGKPRLWMKTEESRLLHGAIPPSGEPFSGYHPYSNPQGFAEGGSVGGREDIEEIIKRLNYMMPFEYPGWSNDELRAGIANSEEGSVRREAMEQSLRKKLLLMAQGKLAAESPDDDRAIEEMDFIAERAERNKYLEQFLPVDWRWPTGSDEGYNPLDPNG